METTFYQEIMAVIIPAVMIAVTTLISLGLHELKKYVRSKTDNEVTNFAVSQFSDIVKTTVAEINQNVKQLSEDGKLTPQDAVALKNMAVNKVMNQLTPDMKKTLEKANANLKEWADSKIEQEVGNAKPN